MKNHNDKVNKNSNLEILSVMLWYFYMPVSHGVTMAKPG